MRRSDAELESLLGAYALDAVDADERAEIDEYLARSPRARGEVDEHRAVAMALGNSAGPAPSHVWATITGSIDAAAIVNVPSTLEAPIDLDAQRDNPRRKPIRRTVNRPVAGGGRWSAGGLARPSFGLAAACCAFVAAASTTVWQGRQISQLRADVNQSAAEVSRTKAQAANERARAGDAAKRIAKLETDLASAGSEQNRIGQLLGRSTAHVVELAADSGNVARVVFDDKSGEAMLISERLPALGSDKTYQLWGVQGKTVLSLGVLGPNPTTSSFAANGKWDAFVLTEELAPGVPSSSQPALAVGKTESI